MIMDLDALLPQALFAIALLAVGYVIGMTVETRLQGKARAAKREWWNRQKDQQARADGKPVPLDASSTRPVPSGNRDVAEQLRVVTSATFRAQPLLNKSEARLFKELDRMVIGRNPGWQVMAQVSLGEILWSENKDAFLCINSKRVDLLLVDEECRARHAIEYQGGGHHQGMAAVRDAVKKEALRKAGIGYHEVVKGEMKRADLLALVEKLVDLPRPEVHAPESAATVPHRPYTDPQPAG